ncbi:hypothetical protein N665_0017s0066 [Sinapis alba]|nr:hypothetical protein N665_0017s0066 [Sinapis alba]
MCLGAHWCRRIQRALRHLKVTVLCLVLTVVVLRGTIGAGKFGTPEQDLDEIRQHFHTSRKRAEPHRVLEEIQTGEDSSSSTTSGDGGGGGSNNYETNPTFPNFIGQNKPHVLTGSAPKPCENPLLLSHPEIEFLWWMDSDAMFTDMAFELPWERYKDYNLNWIVLNTRSFLLRNNQWALDLLDTWAPMGTKGKTRELKGRPVFEADDQSAMVYLLATQQDTWGNKRTTQILQIYGFTHKSLASRKVKRVRNETSNPREMKDELGLLHPAFKAV